MSRRLTILDNVHFGLGIVMIGSLALIIVTFPLMLIWIGQPAGAAAALIADAFAWLFAAAFFVAFVLSVVEQRKSDGVRHQSNEAGQH